MSKAPYYYKIVTPYYTLYYLKVSSSIGSTGLNFKVFRIANVAKPNARILALLLRIIITTYLYRI